MNCHTDTGCTPDVVGYKERFYVKTTTATTTGSEVAPDYHESLVVLRGRLFTYCRQALYRSNRRHSYAPSGVNTRYIVVLSNSSDIYLLFHEEKTTFEKSRKDFFFPQLGFSTEIFLVISYT